MQPISSTDFMLFISVFYQAHSNMYVVCDFSVSSLIMDTAILYHILGDEPSGSGLVARRRSK